MRSALLALMASGAAAVATPAVAREMAYCIKGCDFGGGAGDCSFASLAQCQATASGRDATCVSNPYFSKAELPTTELPTNHNRLPRRNF